MHSSCILVSFNGVWVTVVHNIDVLLTYSNQLNVKGSYDQKQNFYSSRCNITMTKKSWKPLARRLKSNYRTHRLIPTCTDLIEYKATWLYYFLGIMLPLMFAYFCLWSMSKTSSESAVDFDGMLGLFGLSVSLFIGCSNLVRAIYPFDFNKKTNRLRKGWDKNVCKLSDISSLQILSELRGKNVLFEFYELNIVLKKGGRVHLVSQRKANSVRQDGKILAAFLYVPLVDQSTKLA